ncbi:intracellular sulfur oxidation DsrE/DsrF family protein [Lewinella marina]|uniref:Sulfur reduction protein DsrE n=1 Tax=Neolewinella marina TaxID=438751 RepID=A0A2G0CD76_9BACT|nr:DsrE family protein [Neolewinella marina]NJB86870.1 intracellular sulfur oxidation DsrE/DsrF family protein [Neolewinella marina]PHK97931.1 hypothetical protein CGL56_14045 [Neolewinella marina]
MRLLLFLLFLAPALAAAQEKVTPIVPFGGIYEVPEATVVPDPELEYHLIVDVVSGAETPDTLVQGLYNVARMLNLFSVGGVPAEQVHVVLAIHGSAAFGVMENDLYRERFGVDNPNLPLIEALHGAGVKLTVCGQSLRGREIPLTSVAPQVEIATSMLTTVAMYQMKGYAMLRF